ncbi:glycerophosphodiester phosphodiesterase domain-containing protein 5 isoform X2 [Oncorhynchus mykiss]|uniref:glycerophosphodiester phosphodiesterase domain-containing protein 5 isoform X2 n=1 Tax=Oncorhynchus mykiss TaxID=8022 RepID=UPI0018782031|nr:glycerophosphodiester phosphodiesterase domain-containing protein 5 isoform X2 [Oncorhynchus mykiss]
MAPSLTTLGKLPVVRCRLLQRYEHQPFVSCLAGLYGCQWRRYQRTRATPGDCCCSKLECASFALLIVTFCLTLVFLYFWSEAQNDYNDFDWFNFGNLGFWFPWSVVLLVIAAAFFSYITLLLLLAVCLLSEGQKLYLHWGHKIGVLVSLAFSILAIAVLSDLCSKEWTTLLLSFQVTAPYLHVGGVLLMTLLSWPIALHFYHINRKVGQALIMGLYLAVLCALYLVPLGMYSPCLKEEGTLGLAPALIGHRGAPMLAPENTLMSFEKAVEAGGQGLETDVTISYDGVPFLMHDHTLRRTTNVQEVFPNRTDAPAAMFTWGELETLNAGAWFLHRDPFSTAWSLSTEDRAQVQNQSVCTFRDFLELASQRGKQVLWLPSDLRSLVQQLDPDLQHTSASRAPVEELQQNHIVQLNLHYSSMSTEMIMCVCVVVCVSLHEIVCVCVHILTGCRCVNCVCGLYSSLSEYAAANISTNLYVISQSWLYSLAWCTGAQSVTTNALQFLNKLSRPLFLMTPDEYNLMWVLTDVVSITIIIIIFIFHWWREQSLAFCSGSKPTLEHGTYIKFRTDVWSVSSVNILGEPAEPNLATVSEH